MGKKQFFYFKGIVESTLREGRQFHRANFTMEQQIRIVELLTAIGVDFIEVSNPAGQETFQEIKQLVLLPSHPSLLAHVRSRVSDIKAAIDAGVDGVNILSIADEERLKSMGMTFEEHLSQLQQSISLAKKAGLSVRVGSEHYFSASQKNKERARQAFRLADSLGVSRISIPDTLGVATSRDVAEEISAIRELIKEEIEVHFHNDFMQANSNALEAVRNGAHWVDTTILGIGERTGITPLSVFLATLYRINPQLVAKYHLEYLTEVDKSVAEMLGIEVPFNMITSPNGATHKAGIHLDGIIKNGPSLYEPVSPGIIGNRRRLIIGSPVSGKTDANALEQFYAEYGIK